MIEKFLGRTAPWMSNSMDELTANLQRIVLCHLLTCILFLRLLIRALIVDKCGYVTHHSTNIDRQQPHTIIATYSSGVHETT